MRIALVSAAVVLGAPVIAAAAPWRDVVVHGPRHGSVAAAFTGVSHTLYMNDCMPNGCTVRPGWDDSRQDISSIPQQQSHLDAYQWGRDHFDALVQCVRDTFAPFDIDVVTDDPGTENHFEVMVAGLDTQLQMDGALGVAPFVPCDGALEENVMTFVFANLTDNIDQLCWAVAQEASHAWGLDHELNAGDPMTYLYPPLHKEFQDDDADCGEELTNPRECWCGGSTQNSYRYLMDTFGPSTPVPPTATIVAPRDGAWVTPGFEVRAELESQLSVESFGLSVDGTSAGTSTEESAVFTTSPSLAGGDHRIEVTATDRSGQTATDAIDVHVTATCDGNACADGFSCLGGNCLPGPEVQGGLGSTCAADADCITGECWTGGDAKLCTQACDAGRVCPDGYDCIGEGDGACWPGAPDSGGGGCAANGGAGAAPILAGLGLLVALRRRRRA